MTRPMRASLVAALALGLAACVAEPSPTPSPAASPTATIEATPSASSAPGGTAGPTASPDPTLKLRLPQARDSRRVRFVVDPKVDPDGDGSIQVTVENLSNRRIDEIVLRWPTEVKKTLFLAPFAPTRDRVAEGGPPLHYAWTRWVEGPGELGEPAGTTTLGYGPLQPGQVLTIPLVVTRRGPGRVAFEMQFLSGVPHEAPVPPEGDALLRDPDGDPAETRIEIR